MEQNAENLKSGVISASFSDWSTYNDEQSNEKDRLVSDLKLDWELDSEEVGVRDLVQIVLCEELPLLENAPQPIPLVVSDHELLTATALTHTGPVE